MTSVHLYVQEAHAVQRTSRVSAPLGAAPLCAAQYAAEMAYAAGFFDGEGYIGTRRVRSRKPDSELSFVRLRVHVTQVDRAPLDWLQERFGGRVRFESGGNGHSRHRWELLRAEHVHAFLEAISPYLIVKRDRVRDALVLGVGELLPNIRSTAAAQPLLEDEPRQWWHS